MPELHWLTRDADRKSADRVPYRLLEEVSSLSATERDPQTENMLIQGDNLDALKALLPVYAGQVKCIFIDPPYNTRSAFEHYDDNLEHSQWLSMMYPRLMLLRDFLREDGSIWVTIDDNEAHYLKVIMDEVFGRRNFISSVVWQKRTSRENRAAIGSSHDHVLVYGRVPATEWKQVRNLLPDSTKGYANPDQDPRGRWRSIPFTAQGFRENQMYPITTPTGVVHNPPRGRCWGATEPTYLALVDKGRVYFPRGGDGKPRTKKFEYEETGLVPNSWWEAKDFGDNEDAKKEILALDDTDAHFGTPKPELLLSQIIRIATNEGEIVFDSFVGSGTTAAVAHKMNRRYIAIEMGDHSETHCVPRLRKVIGGEQGGISESVGWQGGGGFRFYRLGKAIFDAQGEIDPAIKFPQLAAHVWFTETRTPRPHPRRGEARSPLLGTHGDTAYYLLYNGILGDRHPQHGNVLTRAILAALPEYDGARVIYGESCHLSPTTLERLNITFKQTPYDVRAR